MSERKSKKIDAHDKEIKKLIIATVFIGLISFIFAKDWMVREADQFIDEFYSHMNTTTNSTNTTVMNL